MAATLPNRWLAFVLDNSTGAEGTIRACRRRRIAGRAWYAYTPRPGRRAA